MLRPQLAPLAADWPVRASTHRQIMLEQENSCQAASNRTPVTGACTHRSMSVGSGRRIQGPQAGSIQRAGSHLRLRTAFCQRSAEGA